MQPLDRIDFKILDLLQNNARLTNKEVAAAVGLAPSTCLGRVRRLQEEGVVRGSHAEVAPWALGIGLQAIITVRMGQHSDAIHRAFHDHLEGLPEVVAIFHTAGTEDYLLHVAVKDSDHLRRLAVEDLAYRDEVSHIETKLIFEHRRKASLPNYASVS